MERNIELGKKLSKCVGTACVLVICCCIPPQKSVVSNNSHDIISRFWQITNLKSVQQSEMGQMNGGDWDNKTEDISMGSSFLPHVASTRIEMSKVASSLTCLTWAGIAGTPAAGQHLSALSLPGLPTWPVLFTTALTGHSALFTWWLTFPRTNVTRGKCTNFEGSCNLNLRDLQCHFCHILLLTKNYPRFNVQKDHTKG